MRIAINTRWLLPGKREGLGWYTYHVTKRITENFPEAEIHLLYDRKIKAHLIEGLNVTNHIIYPQARHPILWHIWNEISVPLALKLIRPDVYFSPDGFLPNGGNYKKVVTIHDLNFEEEESFLQGNVRRYYQKYVRAAAQNADHIFTVSAYSKYDIEKRYNIVENKISYAHNGPQQKFRDLHRFEQSIKQRYAHTHSYFLFVGAQNPRKNLHRIFQAFDAFCRTCKTDHRLVLVGEKMLWNDEITLAWENMLHKDRVEFTGRLDTDELNKVYSAATALVYPSLFEGFGMPIIEAFLSGCPVITSLASSMPEVAGNAAMLVDPTVYQEITEAMKSLALDSYLRESYRKRGFERSSEFNWDKASNLIVSKIKELFNA